VQELLDLLLALRHGDAPTIRPDANGTHTAGTVKARNDGQGRAGGGGDGGAEGGGTMSAEAREIQELVLQTLLFLFRSGSTSRQGLFVFVRGLIGFGVWGLAFRLR